MFCVPHKGEIGYFDLKLFPINIHNEPRESESKGDS